MAKNEISRKDAENVKKDIVKEIKNKVLEEVHKEIKTSIVDSVKNYKEDLKEELLEDVNNEVEDLVKKEEKRLLKGKNVAIFKRDIVIVLFLGVILYFGYCLFDVKYFNFMKSECERNGNCLVSENVNKPEGENKEQVPEVIKDKEWYITNYGYLIDNVKLSLNADNVSAYYLYSTDRQVSDIKPSVLLNMAYKNVNTKNIKTNSVTITIDGNALKDAFTKLFGSSTNYKPSDFTYNCLQFKYNQDKDKYTADNKKCTSANNKILETIDDIYEEGNVLYIITNAAIYNELENSFYTFDNLYEPEVSGVNENDFNAHARRVNRYQYQFKKMEENYYLDSIIKLR